MKKLSINTLFVTIFSISIITLLASLIAVYFVYVQRKDLSKKADARQVSSVLAMELLQSSNFLTRNARAYVATGDKKYKKVFLDIINIRNGDQPRPLAVSTDYPVYVIAAGKKFFFLDLLKDYGFTNEEFKMLEEAKNLSDALVKREDKAIKLVSTKYTNDSIRLARRMEAIAMLNDEVYNGEVRKIRKPVQQFFAMVDQRTKKERGDSEDALNFYLGILIFIIILNLIVGVLSRILMKNKVIKPITYISTVANDIAKGDISQKLMITNKDELGNISQSVNKLVGNLESATGFIQKIEEGNFDVDLDIEDIGGDYKKNLNRALIKMRDKLIEVAEQDAQRNWLNEGFAKFGTLLRENNDLKELTNVIVGDLVHYVGAKQGALLLQMEEGQQELELLACYAYDRRKYLHKTIRIGDGLVGQVFLEKQTLYMTNVPGDYINIESALGEASPRSILISPLKINDNVVGVLELASFKEFEPHQIEFIEKLAESIASTITNVRVNEMTKKLLVESQEQAEQLRAAEEEMRQNMEELQATQENLQKQAHELDSLTAMLNNANIATVELSLEGKIQNANSAFLELMGYDDIEDVLWKNDRVFMDEAFVNDDSYRTLWRELEKDGHYLGDFKQITKNKKVREVRGAYTLTKTKEGKPDKVVKLLVDISKK